MNCARCAGARKETAVKPESTSMSAARKAHSESTDVAIACVCIVVATPALFFVGVVVMWIFNGWRGGIGAP